MFTARAGGKSEWDAVTQAVEALTNAAQNARNQNAEKEEKKKKKCRFRVTSDLVFHRLIGRS
jgi:hypothetical protein